MGTLETIRRVAHSPGPRWPQSRLPPAAGGGQKSAKINQINELITWNVLLGRCPGAGFRGRRFFMAAARTAQWVP